MWPATLDDDEWSVLMDNFQAVKDLLRGKKAQLQGVKRKFEEVTLLQFSLLSGS